MLAAITPVLCFIAFLLLLLVSLSVPIIKSIYLFSLTAKASSSLFDASADGSVKFGVWGYCVSSVDVSVLGLNHDSAAQCSKTKLGYNFDNTISEVLHVNGLENAISRTLTAALVLHPIACALTFLALLSSLFIVRRHTGRISRPASFFTMASALIAALLSTIAFLIDVIFVAIVRHRVNDATDGALNLTWGDAVWMTLGATIALWASLVGSCVGLFGLRRNAPKDSSRY